MGSWVIRFYKFTVLPLGISTGPYIFTKVLRLLIRYWRLQAIIIVYLDDGLGICPTFPDCYSQLSMAVKSDLSQAGFGTNSVKSIWVPVQSLRWLGYQWDLKDNLLSIPVEKIDRLLARIDIVLLQVDYQPGNLPLPPEVLFLICLFLAMRVR